jgi:electron transport complex protein RnfB
MGAERRDADYTVARHLKEATMAEKSDTVPVAGSGDSDEYIGTTIPVRVDIDMAETVLSFTEAEKILRSASSIALGPCGCRKTEQKCDAPLLTCLSLNHSEETLATEQYAGFAPVTIEQALVALRASHEAGLVHLAYRKPGKPITEFCSCCSCCCWFFKKLKESDYHADLTASAYVAEHDMETCVGCGTCVERCHFDAWTPSENGGRPSLDAARCYGCGLCVSSCPTRAVTLVPRS